MKVVPHAESSQSSNSNRRWLLPFTFALVAIVSAGIGGAVGFWRGTEYGKKQATSQAVKAIADIANPLSLLANNPLFPGTVVGKVTEANDKAMTVKLINGESKKIAFDDKTTISKENKVLAKSDIKKDVSVTVFTKTKGDDKNALIATRIVLR